MTLVHFTYKMRQDFWLRKCQRKLNKLRKKWTFVKAFLFHITKSLIKFKLLIISTPSTQRQKKYSVEIKTKVLVNKAPWIGSNYQRPTLGTGVSSKLCHGTISGGISIFLSFLFFFFNFKWNPPNSSSPGHAILDFHINILQVSISCAKKNSGNWGSSYGFDLGSGSLLQAAGVSSAIFSSISDQNSSLMIVL